jgi:hypothetical protein
MLESVLTKIGLPILINIVAEALRGVDTPVTKGAAKALEEVEAAIKAGQITPAQMEEAHRHAEEMAKLRLEKDAETVRQVNQSLRAEVVSEDPYVRRMRPTFGYLMAFTWAAQMLGLAYVIVFDTAKSVMVLNAMGSLSAIWAVGLSVLGIYVYKRSEDKKTSADQNKEVIY